MEYELRVSERAEEQIDQAVGYVAVVLGNPTAAKAILQDIRQVFDRLTYAAEALPYCEDSYLRAKEYRKIALERHRYVFLYRIEEKVVYIAGFFHMMENYREKL